MKESFCANPAWRERQGSTEAAMVNKSSRVSYQRIKFLESHIWSISKPLHPSSNSGWSIEWRQILLETAKALLCDTYVHDEQNSVDTEETLKWFKAEQTKLWKMLDSFCTIDIRISNSSKKKVYWQTVW